MNYELAKKLKEAGFPQRKETFAKIGGINFGSQVDDGTKEGLTIPSLKELIEACGNRLNQISNLQYEESGKKVYKGRGWVVSGDGKMVIADIFEEAVANLWLELNKK